MELSWFRNGLIHQKSSVQFSMEVKYFHFISWQRYIFITFYTKILKNIIVKLIVLFNCVIKWDISA